MQEHNNNPDQGHHHRQRHHFGPESEYGQEHHHPGSEGHSELEHLNEDGRLRHLRNFWHEWHDERHHGHPEEFQAGQALSPKEMEAWHEFLHQSFGTWPEDRWIFGGRRFSPWHQGMDTFNPFVANLLSKGGAAAAVCTASGCPTTPLWQ